MISIVREQMMRSQPRLRKRFRSHQGHTFRVKKLKLKEIVMMAARRIGSYQWYGWKSIENEKKKIVIY
jgi:hypothetical protein